MSSLHPEPPTVQTPETPLYHVKHTVMPAKVQPPPPPREYGVKHSVTPDAIEEQVQPPDEPPVDEGEPPAEDVEGD